MFQAHIKEYSDLPWNGEAMLHLGCDAKNNGRFFQGMAWVREVGRTLSLCT